MNTELPPIPESKGQLELFQIRRVLGRTVMIMGNLVQIDLSGPLTEDDPDDLIA